MVFIEGIWTQPIFLMGSEVLNNDGLHRGNPDSTQIPHRADGLRVACDLYGGAMWAPHLVKGLVESKRSSGGSRAQKEGPAGALVDPVGPTEKNKPTILNWWVVEAAPGGTPHQLDIQPNQ